MKRETVEKINKLCEENGYEVWAVLKIWGGYSFECKKNDSWYHISLTEEMAEYFISENKAEKIQSYFVESMKQTVSIHKGVIGLRKEKEGFVFIEGLK